VLLGSRLVLLVLLGRRHHLLVGDWDVDPVAERALFGVITILLTGCITTESNSLVTLAGDK